jgi:DNA repair ATPase RecN
MDDVINLDTLRAEVDRKGCLLSETWTDLYSLLTKYQAQLHVKYDGIRDHVIKTEQEDQNGAESQELHQVKQEIHRKETLLSKYQIDLIKTTDTLERVKHELRLCQAKLDQVSELKHRHEEDLQRLKSSAEKREETICQLKGMVYAKETELVHKSR